MSFELIEFLCFQKNCSQQTEKLTSYIENARKLNVRLQFYSKIFAVTFEEIFNKKIE